MTYSKNDYTSQSSDGSVKRFFRKFNLRLYFTGMLPLFLLAHFGHHGIGAMLNPLMPMIRDNLSLSYTQVGLVSMAFTLTAGLSQLPAGMIADKLGMRVMVLLGVTGVAIGGFFIGFTNSIVWLVVFLVISGLLGGGYHPASAAAISSSVKEEYRGRTLGLHLVGGTSAFWIIPLLATPMAAQWGWRVPYIVISIPLMILGVFLYFYIGKKTKADLKRKSENPDRDEPSKPVGSIRWGQIIPFIIISVFTGTIVQSVSFFIALYAKDVLGVSATTAGLLTAVTPAIGVIGAPLGGYFGDRLGGMKVILIISFLSAPLVYFLGIAPSVPILVLLMVAIGLISSTRMPVSESFLTSNAPANRRATIMGIYYFSGTGVAAPLTPVVGNMVERFGFSTTFGYAAAITAVITILCTLVLLKTGRYKKYPEMTG